MFAPESKIIAYVCGLLWMTFAAATLELCNASFFRFAAARFYTHAQTHMHKHKEKEKRRERESNNNMVLAREIRFMGLFYRRAPGTF